MSNPNRLPKGLNSQYYQVHDKLEIRQPLEQRQIQGNNQLLGHVLSYKIRRSEQQTFQYLQMMLSFMTLNLIRRCHHLLMVQMMKGVCQG